jgi:hypothetical protein
MDWIGRIVVLLCTTADTWSHELVPCPFFPRPSKKQLRACDVFRKKVTFVKGSFCKQRKLRMSQFKQWANVMFCQKLGKSASETFQMIKQAYGEGPRHSSGG